MKTTEEKIKVMQAWLDGKKIKIVDLHADRAPIILCKKDYASATFGLTWNWERKDYSIVEEPNEIWVVVGPIRNQVFDRASDAKRSARTFTRTPEVRHYREVVDET